MHPIVDKGLAGGSLRLGDLVWVMGGDVILAAGVNVHRLAQVFHAHGRALDVPAGVAPAPRRIPLHDVLWRRLAPQGKVGGMMLFRVDRDAGTGAHLVQSLSRQPPIVREATHVKVDPVADFIGVTQGLQPSYQGDHPWDVFGGPGSDVRSQDVERGGVLEKKPRIVLRDLPRIPTRPPRADGHAILALVGVGGEVAHVGDVHHLPHLVAQVLKGAPDDVGHDVGAHVADVRLVVDGGATVIHPHLSRLNGPESLFAACHRVVDSDPHAAAPFSIHQSCRAI